MSNPFSCIHPLSQYAAIAVTAAGLAHAAVLLVIRRRRRWLALGAYPLLIVTALWLGSYQWSPLGFSSGHVPVLRGFRILQGQRSPVLVASGQTVSLASGSMIAIEPDLHVQDARCLWSSLNGAALDDPHSCATAYVAGSRALDVLKIRVDPACGLPHASGVLKLNILP
jgi:hypothetical protein